VCFQIPKRHRGNLKRRSPNPTSFVRIGTCGATLAVGATCDIFAAFAPAATGALSAAVTLTDNATGSPQKVTLAGTGTAAPTVKLSATTISFPTTTHGTVSAAQSITVTNSGTATLNTASIALAGTNPTNFVQVNTCAPTLAPAASCAIYVAFKPAAAAAYSASIKITDNGASSPQSITLSGTGK
jgi:trimeric autotransporter adhesin